MLNWILRKIIGTKNQRQIKKLWPMVHEINRIEQRLQGETDEALSARTAKWQEQFKAFHPPLFLAGVCPAHRGRSRRSTNACAGLADKFGRLARTLPHPRSATGGGGRLEERAARRQKRPDPPGARRLRPGAPRSSTASSRTCSAEILPEAFAVVKNAARRLCGREITVCDQPLHVGDGALRRAAHRRHRACIAGMIAEMATGEGKTLVATLPVYLNALTGRGVHLVTVNDYLARRDARVDGRALQVPRPDGRLHPARPVRRTCAASSTTCDITYGTNTEFGFDYLRDNGMATQQGAAGAARPLLRDRRRGGLHPHRRGAHAAHHQRPGRPSRTHQYDTFKPLVEQLVQTQNALLQPARRPRPRSTSRRARPRRPAASYVQGEARPAEEQARCCALMEDPRTRKRHGEEPS